MRTEIRIAGFGGQGVVLAGLILGQAAIREGKQAVQTQSYGPESRGGAARSEIVISNEAIDYPKVIEADILVALSQTAFDKFYPAVKEKGTIIVDSDLVTVQNKQVHAALFTKTADELGKKVVANSIMLGFLAVSTGVVSEESLKATLEENVPKHTIKLNIEACNRGIELWKNGR